MSVFIFLIYLINTCLVPILLQANFSVDYKDSFMDRSFSAGGRNSDFGVHWYPDIGNQLLICTIVLSLQPIICMILEFLHIKLDRYFKRNFTYKYLDNNHTDNIKFLEMNVGPEYPFQVKTASLNSVLFITLVFGMAFPLLYPIAIFAITL